MVNPEHVAILKQGVEAWNQWREENPDIEVDLSKADLSDISPHTGILDGTYLSGANFSSVNLYRSNLRNADLSRVNFYKANLREANLVNADLWRAVLIETNLERADLWNAGLVETDFSGADLTGVNLERAVLWGAIFKEANLSGIDFSGASLNRDGSISEAHFSREILFKTSLHYYSKDIGTVDWRSTINKVDLSGANLVGTDLSKTNLAESNLRQANLSNANLSGANLSGANFSQSNMTGTNLRDVKLLETNFNGAELVGCQIYGISAWNLQTKDSIQQDLVISKEDEPTITVDSIEVAQFIYLLLNNEKIRSVIDTVTSKSVLILGRFNEGRKPVLDAIRDELRKHNYVPILFDFDKPSNRDLTETVMTLAGMSRFVIADLSDPNSIPHEVMSFARDLPSVPVQAIFTETPEHAKPYPMYEHLGRYRNVLEIFHYEDKDHLIASLPEHIIKPAEEKAKEMQPPKLW